MATLIVQPSAKDNHMRQFVPTANYGTSVALYVRSHDLPDNNDRSILEFDISGLPADITLISATLSLYAWSFASVVGRTYWAYKLTRIDWVEAQATWNIYKTGNNWTVGGGDYVTSEPSGGSAIVPAAAAWMNWDVLAIVQDAYDEAVAAEFLVRDETENQDGTNRYTLFWSKEYLTDTSLRPKLTIVYSIPTVAARGWFSKF